MKKYLPKIETINCLDDVICDCCKQSCKGEFNFNYMTLSAEWFYGSLHDGENWEAHICDKCADDLKQKINFKIDHGKF